MWGEYKVQKQIKRDKMNIWSWIKSMMNSNEVYKKYNKKLKREKNQIISNILHTNKEGTIIMSWEEARQIRDQYFS